MIHSDKTDKLDLKSILSDFVQVTDLFNHSKGLFFNRALEKFSKCQDNMSGFCAQIKYSFIIYHQFIHSDY